jgi:adenine-specific DNA-methyltransferase
MKETVLNGATPDIAEKNIQKLRQVFPEVFTEDKVDFEKLQQVLGNYVEDSTERYNFTWNGKGQALRLSQTPSLGTLRPCKEESKNWDTTQNLYIEGDNLEVLKLLQKSYHGKVKMIYIDPPYNTGKDFVYSDDFHDSLENYKKITGQIDDEGNKISTNTEASGRYHTDWLNMMYPRLRLARNLLSDDGAIFISIDDNEIDNLKKVGNEVFGEDNFIASIIWKRKRGRDNSAKWFSKSHEYLLLYGKSKDILNINYLSLDIETKKAYKNPDNDYRGDWRMLACWARGTQGGVLYDFTTKSGQYFSQRLWLFSKENLILLDKEDKLVIRGDNLYRKLFLSENRGKIPETLWDNVSNAANASDEIKRLFEETIVFDTPKPIPYVMEMLKIISQNDSLVLDFFSGSATTAHATMQLNAEDGGNRKFIMVQLPEPTDKKSEAYKAGYKNICEIGKERIRRAGEKIKEEKGLEAQDLDVGFKVLKLDTSNIRKWQPDYENLEKSLEDYTEHYVKGRSELDVVYEIMLKYGLDLTYSIDEFEFAGKKVYSIGFGMLMICLENELTTEVAKGILQKIKELSPESTRVVFKDSGFKADADKTNIKEILKCGGIEEFVTL